MTGDEKGIVAWISRWIDDILKEYEAQARTVASLGFLNLPNYYSKELLENTKVVFVDHVPFPPLEQIGLPVDEIENRAGIAFKDHYFVLNSEAKNEAIHLHELVHIVQWKHLGYEKFIHTYLTFHVYFGYDKNPLERHAYQIQDRFVGGYPPEMMEPLIIAALEGI
jgi:hypothetical protein